MTANRIYTPVEKLKIVPEGMNRAISLADLCRKYNLKDARFYYRKDQIMSRQNQRFPRSQSTTTITGALLTELPNTETVLEGNPEEFLRISESKIDKARV
jgi:transposase-like protein